MISQTDYSTLYMHQIVQGVKLHIHLKLTGYAAERGMFLIILEVLLTT
jgi:hypothetical protein